MDESKRLAGAAALLVAAASVVGAGPAAADAPATSGATSDPLSSVFRNCNHVPTHWVSASGAGSGSALITAGANQVSAQVNLQTATPDTGYTVRLIQVPRATDRTCTVGDPGVAVGELFTDGNGTGSATVQGPIVQGMTGAWVSVDGPPPAGGVIGEFYTSEVAAPLA